MADARNINVLNRLLQLECRSLPMYLEGASPWTHQGDERAARELANLIADEKRLSTRIADLILDRGGLVDPGSFPMKYTDMHMLSLDYLLGEIVAEQQATIGEIERCVGLLRGDAEARSLAEEALGAERGHAENLAETIKELV